MTQTTMLTPLLSGYTQENKKGDIPNSTKKEVAYEKNWALLDSGFGLSVGSGHDDPCLGCVQFAPE
jgi:hypothetical protein